MSRNITISAAQFFGAGLNDLTGGGAWTTIAPANALFQVTISATGAPDHFTWTKNGGTASSPVAITGAAQALSDGITVTFAATTGHTLAASWVIRVTAGSSVSGDYLQGGVGALFKPLAERLGDVISLDSYAVADGSTINTAGVQRWIDAARSRLSNPTLATGGAGLYVPASAYPFLIDQTIVIRGFVGLRFYGASLGQSVFQWVGGTSGPMFRFQGNYKLRVHDLQFKCTAAFPIESLLDSIHGVNFIDSTPQQLVLHDCLVISDDSARYLFRAHGIDANNDFHNFQRCHFQGWSDTALWFQGSQSYSHRVVDCIVNCEGGAGQFGIRTTTSAAAPIASASWSGGVATYVTTEPHLLATGALVVITAIFPIGYGVDSVTATVTGATTFTVPMVSNPGAYVSGGTVTGNFGTGVSGGAASATFDGGYFSTQTADYYNHGYSQFPLVVRGANIETNGFLLFSRGQQLGSFTVEDTRWNKIGTGTNTDFIDYLGSGELIVRNCPTILSNASATDVTLKYVYSPSQGKGGLILEHSLIYTTKTTLAEFLTGASPTNGLVHTTEFQWNNGSSSGEFDGVPDTIVAASWATGTATYTIATTGSMGTGGGKISVTGTFGALYDVSNVICTVLTSTTFSVPMAVNPGAYTGGGKVTCYNRVYVSLMGIDKLIAGSIVVDNLQLVNPLSTATFAGYIQTALAQLGPSFSYGTSGGTGAALEIYDPGDSIFHPIMDFGIASKGMTIRLKVTGGTDSSIVFSKRVGNSPPVYTDVFELDSSPLGGLVVGAFGCNGTTPSLPYGLPPAVSTTTPTLGSYGFTLAQATDLITMANELRHLAILFGFGS